MNKVELLSPVGNIDCLYQAIHNGADAVYLGLKTFGARNYAKNFDEEEIISAIKLCHLYDVKIYVTMNTLIKDNEVDEFINQVDFLHKNGVDAIIMQDFGMICLCREMFPNLEIHASTQANNSSIETIKLFHKIGVKRVVLSRELSLDEINNIDVDIELEVFIHGALCISYSGNCLMSSMMGNRSGNRGECTGCCRMPYSLYENNKLIESKKYLLSTKEFNSTYHINELLSSNIKSFKIEGRMKSREYVGFVTKLYRKLIDKEDINLKEENEKLKTLYNRKFTDGHLFNSSDIINNLTPNHIGLRIGKVVEINNKRIKIKLDNELNQEDGIRFLESGKGFICNYLYDSKDRLISSSNSYVYVDNKVNLTTYDNVYKTIDKNLNNSLSKYTEKKIPINMKLIGKIGNKLKLIISDYKNIISEELGIVEEAKTNPISPERIINQLKRLGNTPFILDKINLDIDTNIFISIKDLNELRRVACDKLLTIRQNKKINYLKKKIVFEKLNTNNIEKNLYTACIINEEQLLKCLNLGFERIYVRSYELYEKYKDNKSIYYMEHRNQFIIDNKEKKKLISEYRSFNKNDIGNYFFNIYNSYTAYYLLRNGLNSFTLSVELTEDEIDNLMKSFKNNFKFTFTPEILVYGKVENMYIKGNILNIDNRLYTYKLKDIKNRFFDCYLDKDNTVILNYEETNLNNTFNFNYYKRFDFYDETKELIEKIVNKY